jgi:hypothetical protein
MNDDAACLPILRRVGLALIVVGVVDVAVMIYCIVHRIAYASSFNIFAIVAGIFLMRGSLRAAGVISRYAAFMLAGLLGLAFAWPLFLPPGLALAALRIYPVLTLTYSGFFIALLGFLYWVVRELRRDIVMAATARSSTKVRSLTVPILTGAALVVVIAPLVHFALKSDRAKQAEEIAAGEVGEGYSFCVTSMRIERTQEGRTGYAVVTAWNDREIRQIPVSWDEN